MSALMSRWIPSALPFALCCLALCVLLPGRLGAVDVVLSYRLLVDRPDAGTLAAEDRQWHPVLEGTELLLVPAGTTLQLRLASIERVAPDEIDATRRQGGFGRSLKFVRTEEVEWTFSSGSGRLTPQGHLLWIPGSGGHLVRVQGTMTARRAAEGEEGTETRGEVSINLLPALPYDRDGDGSIEGHVVGIYPSEVADDVPAPVARNPQLYQPPVGFYRLDDTTRPLRITPSLTLGGLVPPAIEGDDSRFVAVDRRLFRFLESLDEVLKERDMRPSDVRIVRGFVSPAERLRLARAGVSLASFSRFQYGDALALLIDGNGDGRMDDLSRNGEVGVEDAEHLADIVEEALRRASIDGGVGAGRSFAGPEHVGTPYVHVDLRGWNVRWTE